MKFATSMIGAIAVLAHFVVAVPVPTEMGMCGANPCPPPAPMKEEPPMPKPSMCGSTPCPPPSPAMPSMPKMEEPPKMMEPLRPSPKMEEPPMHPPSPPSPPKMMEPPKPSPKMEEPPMPSAPPAHPPSPPSPPKMSEPPKYGSGMTPPSGYDSCVQKCVADYGAPMGQYTPPPPSPAEAAATGGGGATHTVIVAPSQGVLRYVPFAVNASVGDTIRFVWNANGHTVTKGSQLEICNKTDQAPFASGLNNASFVFTQVVNTTEPTFFYCANGVHCQRGMFGIINPPSALVAPTSVGSMMPALVQNNTNMAAMAAFTTQMTSNASAAAQSWGSSIDMAGMPEWSREFVAQNVMYTRTFLAANPDTMAEDGSINLGASALMIPQDLSVALSANNAAPASPETPAASPDTPAAAPAPSGADAPAANAAANNEAQGNGARSMASSSVAAIVVSVAVAFFAL